MDLRDDVLKCLASTERNAFLARLASDLTVRARDAYTQLGPTPEESSARLQRYNELMHRVTGQLRDSLTGAPTYPDDVFIDFLADAEASATDGALVRGAIKSALGKSFASVH